MEFSGKTSDRCRLTVRLRFLLTHLQSANSLQEVLSRSFSSLWKTIRFLLLVSCEWQLQVDIFWYVSRYSDVVGVNLQRQDGSEIEVQNATVPIKIQIPLKNSISSEFFALLNFSQNFIESSLNFHRSGMLVLGRSKYCLVAWRLYNHNNRRSTTSHVLVYTSHQLHRWGQADFCSSKFTKISVMGHHRCSGGTRCDYDIDRCYHLDQKIRHKSEGILMKNCNQK